MSFNVICYHGSNAKFPLDELKPSQKGTFGRGIYTGDEECASLYADDGELMKLVATLRNPLIVPARYSLGESQDIDTPAGHLIQSLYGHNAPLAALVNDDCHLSPIITDAACQLGYDSILASYEEDAFELIAFDAATLKERSDEVGDDSEELLTPGGAHLIATDIEHNLNELMDNALLLHDRGAGLSVIQKRNGDHAVLVLRTFNTESAHRLNRTIETTAGNAQNILRELVSSPQFDHVHIFDDHGYTTNITGEMVTHRVIDTHKRYNHLLPGPSSNKYGGTNTHDRAPLPR